MGATLKDVAAKAGVSIVTASRVFNENESVKPAFRKKVLDAAKALNYTPNLLARGLAKSNLKLVSVCMGELGNPYFGKLASDLSGEFSRHAYNMIICDSAAKTMELNRSLATAGTVLVSVGNRELMDRISKTRPVVGIGCSMRGAPAISNVGIDFSDAYTQIFEKAVYSDKDRIAFFSNVLKEFPNLAEDKFIHVFTAMKQKGLNPVGNRIFSDIGSLLSYVNASPGSINCVICENDMLAAELHGRLVRRGFKIPEDIVVVGCDGTMVLEGMWSVKIDTKAIASMAVELFMGYDANAGAGEYKVKPVPVYR